MILCWFYGDGEKRNLPEVFFREKKLMNYTTLVHSVTSKPGIAQIS